MDWSLLFSSYGSVFTNLQVIMMTFLLSLIHICCAPR